jgi:long-chain acyl-CoA synthetase
MSVYDERPWLALYKGQPADHQIEHTDALQIFEAGLRRAPGQPALRYFDASISRRELDELSDALAVALLKRGFRRGDRLAVYLQNMPQFVIALVATWKAGGIMVPVNPMSRARELTYVLRDSGAKVLVCLEQLYESVAREVLPATSVEWTLTTSELEYQSRCDERLFGGLARMTFKATTDFARLLEEHRGQTPPAVAFAADDVAFLTYTSGTTGVPKAAMNTHRNVVFATQVFRDWADVASHPDGSVPSVLGLAPLFHITGLIPHIALSLLTPMPLVLAYRFEPQVMLDVIREHRPTFTIAAVTAFTALLNSPSFAKGDFRSLGIIYSGGAPISPSAERDFREATGQQLHVAYGLTETTSPATLTPRNSRSPVDPAFGALSVGLPVPGTTVRIQDDEGRDVPLGEVGEIVIDGPQVVPGYWNKPEETAGAFSGRALKTGDIGFMSREGWVYIVDRKKDMISASGYKVWPREVEDVLAEHPAVRESAVVGVPDQYRGENVKAYVSLKPGMSATAEELIAHCKERMAAYKYPRIVELIGELPTSASGKILRRELRDRAPRSHAGADLAADHPGR